MSPPDSKVGCSIPHLAPSIEECRPLADNAVDWTCGLAYDVRKGKRVKPSRYFLFSIGACPPCGLIAAVCFAILADGVVGASLVLWAFAILIGVPAGLAYLVGNRYKLTGQQVATGSIAAASLACVEAFVLLLIALSQATFNTPML